MLVYYGNNSNFEKMNILRRAIDSERFFNPTGSDNEETVKFTTEAVAGYERPIAHQHQRRCSLGEQWYSYYG